MTPSGAMNVSGRAVRRGVIAWIAAAALSACATTNFDGPGGNQRLYEARCGVCHIAYEREQFGPDEWPGILDEMAPRAGLTRSQRERVFAYLTAR